MLTKIFLFLYMKLKPLFLSVITVLLFGLNSCHEFTSTAVSLFASDDTTSVVFPAPLGSVSDFEKVLTADQIRSLDSIIIQHERRTDNKISIVSTKSIKPFQSLNEYSVNLLDSWEKGDDKNHSILINFSEKLDEVQIITGNSLKKKLTEKDSKRIIKKSIHPEFEKGDYYTGLKRGLQKIIAEIN